MSDAVADAAVTQARKQAVEEVGEAAAEITTAAVSKSLTKKLLKATRDAATVSKKGFKTLKKLPKATTDLMDSVKTISTKSGFTDVLTKSKKFTSKAAGEAWDATTKFAKKNPKLVAAAGGAAVLGVYMLSTGKNMKEVGEAAGELAAEIGGAAAATGTGLASGFFGGVFGSSGPIIFWVVVGLMGLLLLWLAAKMAGIV